MARNFISLHYDGPITTEHKLELRTLGSTLTHMQAAIDRAYLDLKLGRVVKFARLSAGDYPSTDFLLERPRDGGFIIDMMNKGRYAIADRLHSAISAAAKKAMAEPVQFLESMKLQGERKKFLLDVGVDRAVSNEEFVAEQSSKPAAARYADRAINRSFDQVLAQLRVPRYEGSTLEITTAGVNAQLPIRFDAALAHQFHRIVSRRTLGDPVIMDVKIRALDSGRNSTPSGKAINVLTNKDFNIHFHNEADFNSLTAFIKAGKPPVIRIIACPVLEYGVFDPFAGDMFFISLLES